MEQGYWLRRKGEELARASNATSVEARSVHYDLARRCGLKAADIEKFPTSLLSADERPPLLRSTRLTKVKAETGGIAAPGRGVRYSGLG